MSVFAQRCSIRADVHVLKATPVRPLHPPVRFASRGYRNPDPHRLPGHRQPAPEAQVRIIDASPDAPGLDIYQGSTALAYNLGFGTVTSYIQLAPGVYTITADTAGTKQVLSSSKATFAASSQYTVLIGNSAASLQQITLTDQSQPAPSGQIALRFINQATRMTAQSTSISFPPARSSPPSLRSLPASASASTPATSTFPTGTYSLVMVPTGTIPTSTTIATYSGPQVTYTAGSAHTIILIDQQVVSTSGLQVITADDFDPQAPPTSQILLQIIP